MYAAKVGAFPHVIIFVTCSVLPQSMFVVVLVLLLLFVLLLEIGMAIAVLQ